MSIRRTAVAEHAPGRAAALASTPAPSPRSATGLTRRGLGVASVGGLALLAGCADAASPNLPSPASTAPGRSASPSVAPRSDEDLAADALAAERLMVERLAAATTAGTSATAGLAEAATAARVIHDAHVKLLDKAASAAGATPVPSETASPAPTRSPLASQPGSPTGAPAQPAAPDPGATAAVLARDERRLVDEHSAAAVAASSGTFARVLAGLAASAAQQAVILERLARLLPAASDAAP